ncbi:PulJ/GspJ family protein [Parvularcula maris]|uniref:Prepilin-type N-terminal cleavage/methylation domain-containing protein n=1 Tax=Parvularcula maris TaxID=2965077 RepID=A0A9X2RK26_9PROT|nr:prepilin-type N-terminal cleavage/methylation domain-containing protein [Parvularcula maris]
MADARGLTLVEMLVSLVLVSMIAVLITAQLRLQARALSGAALAGERLDVAMVAGTIPGRLLSSAVPLTVKEGGRETVVFEGSADRVTFATIAYAPPIDGALTVYELSIAEGEGGDTLQIARSSLTSYLETGDAEAEGVYSQVAPLPDGMRFAFMAPGGEITDRWEGEVTLPRGVLLCSDCEGGEVPMLSAVMPPREPLCLNLEDGTRCVLERFQ